jgi:acetyl/propionyl-CoA carboxylase alpha subunit
MLAMVIAHVPSREVAIVRLLGALDDTLVHGVVTNLPFLRALLRSPEVRKGTYDTEWIEREFLEPFAALMQAPAPDLALAAVAIAELAGAGSASVTRASRGESARPDVFAALGRWRLGGLE